MRRIIALLLPLAAIAAVAAGCGGSDNGGSTTGAAASTTPAETTPSTTQTPASTTPSTSTSTGTSTSGSAQTLVIKMKDVAFDPAQTTVKVGQKVEWENEDGFDHNVVAQQGADFKSANFGQGKTFEFTPTAAGTIQYVCTLHPGMDGTLTVTG